jgi:phage terminase small subunit
MLSPFLAVASQAYAQMRAMLIEFGMTPASRSRVEVVVPRELDGAAKYLTG